MLPQTNATRYVSDSLMFRGSILWNYHQNDTYSKTSVCSFKKCIKNWSGENCDFKYANDKNTTFKISLYLSFSFF